MPSKFENQNPLLGSKIEWSHPLADGLLGCFLINEGAGGQITDIVNNMSFEIGARVGALPTWENNAFRTTAAAEGYFKSRIVNPTRLKPDFPFTIVGKVMVYNDSDIWQLVDSDYNYSHAGFKLMYSSGSVYLRMGDDTGAASSNRRDWLGAWASKANTWHHYIAVVRGVLDVEFFFDGIPVTAVNGSGTASAMNYTNDTYFYIGARRAVAAYVGTDGWIDHVLLYNKALTPSESVQLYEDNFCFIKKPRSYYYHILGATTAAPTTLAPTTLAPTTLAPTTLAPTTAAPTTLAAETTLAPTTFYPSTYPPTTSPVASTPPPTTLAPTTLAPTSLAPTTLAPTTIAPTTLAPTTLAPTTLAPTTLAPTTEAPTTQAPTTQVPTSLAPTTPAPTTTAPTTLAPTTEAPTTEAPTTAAPTTAVPTTLAPTTLAPTTLAPTSAAPTTSPVTTLTTAVPTTSGATTLVPTTAPPPIVCIQAFDSDILTEILLIGTIITEILLDGNLCR